MQPFTFIHAADLHLDAALPPPPGDIPPDTGKLFSEAVFIALGRLVELCIEKNASFLLLAGDVFHGGTGSLKAAFALSDACKRLGEHGIKVYWARGNHDSLDLGAEAMDWPDNLHIFAKKAENLQVLNQDGEELAWLCGVSHESKHERGNLALDFKKTQEGFQIGVLHCAVHGAQGAHAGYSPCSLGDLTCAGMHYWALGHVHTPAILSAEPLVAYSGSLQGLHVNESGPHGCYVVNVDASGRPKAVFQPLAPIRWEKLRLDLSENEISSLDALEELLLEALGGLCAELAQDAGRANCLLARLELTGRSPLDGALRRAGSLAEFVLRLNSSLAARRGFLPLPVFVKDIQLATSPDLDVESLLGSGNLVGETLRFARAAAARLDELAASGEIRFEDLEEALADLPWGPPLLSALSELYSDRRLEELRPGAEELAEMAREASALCLHLFEVEA